MKENHRLASLDFLRGRAAFMVVIPHFFVFQKIYVETFEAISVLGVEIFFVLSGYVLAPQILLCTEAPQNFSELKIFFIRRWMRTIPPYLVALVCMSVFTHRLGSHDFLRYLVYMQNLFNQANVSDYFSIAWSLSVEEWFYITFPSFLVLFFVAIGRRSLKSSVLAALLFIVLITLARSLFGDYQNWGPNVRRVVLFRIDSIAYGFLLYILLNKTKGINLAKVPVFLVWLISGLVFLIGLSCTLYIGNIQSTGLETLFPFCAAGFGAISIIAALKANPFFLAHKKAEAIALFLGRISYSTYLFHLIVLMTLAGGLPHLPTAPLFFLVLGSTILLAELVYTAIEAPILAARPKFKRKPVNNAEVVSN